MDKCLRLANITRRSLYPFLCSEIRSGSTLTQISDTNLTPVINEENEDQKLFEKSGKYSSWMFSDDNDLRRQEFERSKQWYQKHHKQEELETSKTKQTELKKLISDMRTIKNKIESFSKYAMKCTNKIEKQELSTKPKINPTTEENGIKKLEQSKLHEVDMPKQTLSDTCRKDTIKSEMQENSNDMNQKNNKLSTINNSLNKNGVELFTIQAIDEVNTIPSWLAHYELSEYYKKFDRFKESERADNVYLKKVKPRKTLPRIFQKIRPRPIHRGY